MSAEVTRNGSAMRDVSKSVVGNKRIGAPQDLMAELADDEVIVHQECKKVSAGFSIERPTSQHVPVLSRKSNRAI